MALRFLSQNGSDGPRLAISAPRMLNCSARDTRRKAVWGPKRLTVAFALLLLTSSSVFAAGAANRDGNSSGARAARSSRAGRVYKLDAEIARRKNSNPAERSSVIVTLVPGAELPAQFKRFSR